MFEYSKKNHSFIQSNGAFPLVSCRYNFQGKHRGNEKHYLACEHFCLSLAMMVGDTHAPTLLHDTTNYFRFHCFDREATRMAPLSCGCQPCNNLH